MSKEHIKDRGVDWHSLAIAIMFGVVLLTPPIVAFITPDQTISQREKRNLASKPDWSQLVSDLTGFREQSNSYINDHIGLREVAIQANSAINILAFKVSPSVLALFGKEKWIYYWGMNSNHQSPEKDFKGIYDLPIEMLDGWYINHMALVHSLGQRSTDYVLVIAPDKHSIYPEFLPSKIQRKQGASMLDQFVDYMRDKEIRGFINLKPDILSMKEKSQVYLRTDSHWNHLGYLLTYRKIIDWIRSKYPEVDVAKSDEELIFTEIMKSGDLALMIGFGSYFMEPTAVVTKQDSCANIIETKSLVEFGYESKYQAFVYECPEQSRHLMFVHDSFGAPIKPYLADHFRQTLTSNYGNAYQLDKLVTEFGPDFFVHLRVERELSTLFPHQPKLVNKYLAYLFDKYKRHTINLNLTSKNTICNNCTLTETTSGFDLVAHNDDPHLTFAQPWQKELSNNVTLKIDLTVDQKDKVKIYYTTEESPEASESKVVFALIEPGRNIEYIRIVSESRLTSLRVDPGRINKRYKINELAWQNNNSH